MSDGRRAALHSVQRVATLTALVAVAGICWAFLVWSESAMHEGACFTE